MKHIQLFEQISDLAYVYGLALASSFRRAYPTSRF
jgi:hypothetical protein